LNTHIWLWSTIEPKRISRRVEKAKVFDLTLVTADERLMRLPEIRIMANR
jgi:PIN domain nuclease of toxin-antitoxin system